jgi:hypothetical protein
MNLKIGSATFAATLEDNPTAKALALSILDEITSWFDLEEPCCIRLRCFRNREAIQAR